MFIPTCFTHLHTYFSCLTTMSLNLDAVTFYRVHYRTPNTVSINHALMTYIEHQHSVDLSCSHDIHRTPNTMSIYHTVKHQTQCRPHQALTPDSTVCPLHKFNANVIECHFMPTCTLRVTCNITITLHVKCHG